MGRNEGREARQPINRPAGGLRARGLVVAIAEVSRFRPHTIYGQNVQKRRLLGSGRRLDRVDGFLEFFTRLRKFAQPTGLSSFDSGGFCRACAKSCDGSVSERRRGCVRYFQCREFLEENSRKSGWQALHSKAGRISHEHTYWDQIAMKSTSGGMDRLRASKQRNACSNHSSPLPLSWLCGWRWAALEDPEGGSDAFFGTPAGRPMAMPTYPFAPAAERSAVMWVESTATIGSRLVPASAAVPTAAADQQHNDDNDQKGRGVHTATPWDEARLQLRAAAINAELRFPGPRQYPFGGVMPC
jgi:hypothetical protein